MRLKTGHTSKYFLIPSCNFCESMLVGSHITSIVYITVQFTNMWCPVSGVEMFRETLEKAEAGDNCGVLIKGVKRNEIRRGQILCKPGTCNMHNHVEAQVIFILCPRLLSYIYGVKSIAVSHCALCSTVIFFSRHNHPVNIWARCIL